MPSPLWYLSFVSYILASLIFSKSKKVKEVPIAKLEGKVSSKLDYILKNMV